MTAPVPAPDVAALCDADRAKDDVYRAGMLWAEIVDLPAGPGVAAIAAALAAERATAAREAAAVKAAVFDTHVWIDPARRSGEPCIGGTRIPVEMVADTMWAHGIGEALTQWPHITRPQILVACWYAGAGYPVRLHAAESVYKPTARQWPKRWGAWAHDAHDALWASRYDDVTDPPIRDREIEAQR